MEKTTTIIMVFMTISLSLNAQYFPPQLPETSVVETWNGVQWSNPLSSAYTFNVNCLPLTSNVSSNGSQTLRSTWQYLNDELATEVLIETWNQTSAVWENFQLSLITYSNDNLDITFTNYNWAGNSWVEISRYFLLTNSDDLLLEEIFQEWNNISGTFINTDRDRYIYDSNDILQILYRDAWNEVTSNWDDSERATHNYNANNLLESIETDIWSVNQWVENKLSNYTYNTQDQVTEWVLNIWDDNTNSFLPNQRQLYSDYGDEYPETILYQTWVVNTWFNSLRDSRTYPNCSTLSITESEKTTINIGPNPFKDEIHIDLLADSELKRISIRDISGKEVFGSNLNLRTLNLSSLVAGIYILSLETQNTKDTFKIIKQ